MKRGMSCHDFVYSLPCFKGLEFLFRALLPGELGPSALILYHGQPWAGAEEVHAYSHASGPGLLPGMSRSGQKDRQALPPGTDTTIVPNGANMRKGVQAHVRVCVCVCVCVCVRERERERKR